MDFAEAQKEAYACRKCGPLCHSRTRVVFGEGPLNAELFIVGEAPGFNEDKEGKPFCGASGMLLDRLLVSVGMEREEVYLTTLGSPRRSKTGSAHSTNVTLPAPRYSSMSRASRASRSPSNR